MIDPNEIVVTTSDGNIYQGSGSFTFSNISDVYLRDMDKDTIMIGTPSVVQMGGTTTQSPYRYNRTQEESGPIVVENKQGVIGDTSDLLGMQGPTIIPGGISYTYQDPETKDMYFSTVLGAAILSVYIISHETGKTKIFINTSRDGCLGPNESINDLAIESLKFAVRGRYRPIDHSISPEYGDKISGTDWQIYNNPAQSYQPTSYPHVAGDKIEYLQQDNWTVSTIS